MAMDKPNLYCESYCERKCAEFTGQEWLDCNSTGVDCACQKGVSAAIIVGSSVLAAVILVVLIIILVNRFNRFKCVPRLRNEEVVSEPSSPVVIPESYVQTNPFYFEGPIVAPNETVCEGQPARLVPTAQYQNVNFTEPPPPYSVGGYLQPSQIKQFA